MKKLISILLTIAIICSLTAISASAAKVDVADTNTAQLFFSDEPYADITTVNGYVFGFIGDADEDGEVTIFDATAIQMHLAQLITLSENAQELANVDFNEDISIMDTTEIQLFLARLSENPYITHTLYEDDYIEYTFDQIANYIKTYGSYDSESKYYYTYYEPSDLDNAEYSLFLAYYPEDNCIDFYGQFYQVSTDMYVDTYINIYRGNPAFWFGTTLYDNDYVYCDAFGSAELVDDVDMIFNMDCTDFESDYYADFSEISEISATQFELAIATADEMMWQYIDRYVTDIFW